MKSTAENNLKSAKESHKELEIECSALKDKLKVFMSTQKEDKVAALVSTDQYVLIYYFLYIPFLF